MIVVYGITDKLNPIKAQLSDLLHGCMQSVLGMPEDKRAHRFVPLDRDSFYYPAGRSDAYTVIEINMMARRSPETQKKLIKSIFRELENKLLLSSIDVEITIKEQQPYLWGFRGMTGDEAKDLRYEVNVSLPKCHIFCFVSTFNIQLRQTTRI
ncbi:tautomerase family protein [Aestuariicella sp. G3-2]|nr:tautomerase family protein [Aestuariicella albida]